MQIPSMPFKILALGPFVPETARPWPDSPIKVDKDNLDDVIRGLGLRLHVPVDKSLYPEGGIDIHITRMKDFHPDGILKENTVLKNILDAKKFCDEAGQEGLSQNEIAARISQWPDLPLIRMPSRPDSPGPSSASAVDNILKMVSLPDDSKNKGSIAGPLADQIKGILKNILTQIFSDETFRRLEAAWQGLHLLINQGGIDGGVEVQLAPISHDTLEETLDGLLTHVVQDLPSLVIVDLPFNNSYRSLECLEKIAVFAETVLSPGICWVTQEFLYIDSWDDLKRLSYLPHYLDGPPFAKWRSLSVSPPAKWLTVTCNRFLVRYPYGQHNTPRIIAFNEQNPLWIGPVWALAGLMIQSIARTGWPTNFTDWQNIRIEGLGLDMSRPEKPIATEAAIPENRIDQFARAGITPLVGYRNKDIAFVAAEATVSKDLVSYQLFLSRIIHFILMCKDLFGNINDPKELEDRLSKAIFTFWQITGDPVPKDLKISAGKPAKDNRIPLSIVVEPSRRVLASGKKVTLEFLW